MLPITFDNDPHIRISSLGFGIFALAMLLAGFCATILACVVVRDRAFQATEIFRQALISCILGFLTVFYNYMISSSFVWNIPAILTATAAGAGAITYATLLIRTVRRRTSPVSLASRSLAPSISISRHGSSPALEEPSRYQSPQYYQNYIRNMFPSAAYEPSVTPSTNEQAITEEEMQRQQMLMLLLKQDQTPDPGTSSSTFRIEWQSQEQDNDTPVNNGYIAQGSNTTNSASSYSQSQYGSVPSSVSMRVPGGLAPWDGVWRGVAQRPSYHGRSGSREERRREIELGA